MGLPRLGKEDLGDSAFALPLQRSGRKEMMMYRREEERRMEEERMMGRREEERTMDRREEERMMGRREEERTMDRREEERMMERSMIRRRRRLMVGGAVVVGSTAAMVKMSEADAQRIEQTTGMPPENMSNEELQQAMLQQNIQPQPITQEDQQVMASAEAADPQ